MDAPVLAQTYAARMPDLSIPWQADAPPAPELVWLNEDLARELGYDPAWLRGPEGIALLTGRGPGTTAQVYAGHQFGRPNPQLGDGRAVLLGDLLDTRGRRRDLHLKGSGATPLARNGDGKAPLGPMLREAVIGEFFHAAGVPTTRALAVLTTGERIAPRQGVVPERGAMLVRVAASHLRVGTVEYAAWHLGPDAVQGLVDLAIERHHPSAEAPLDLLEQVAAAQAELLAQWMLLGFVHGVMNTDNMTISGEGIDYGPCAFLDVHRRGAVFSSIDREGRYAYGEQPGIALWNLSRLAEALVPVIDEDPNTAVERATAVLEGFEARFRGAYARGLAAKLGLHDTDEVLPLGVDLFVLLEEHGIDHTGFFRALGEGRAPELFADPAPFEAWRERLLERGGGRIADGVNPVLIPRNVHLDAALRAAELGDQGPVLTLLEAVRRPFEHHPGLAHLEGPGEGGEHFLTFCGT